jgi:hypothetical protein
MAEGENTQKAQAAAPGIPSVRIVQDVPVIFCDGVASQSYGFGVTKMYLSRFDPDPAARNRPTETMVMQLVMPTDAFVMTVAFLEHRLKNMIAEKAVSQDQVDKARDYWVKNPTAGTASQT